ncbi:hypothetical protein AY600_07425 [Phormidium willei BDU 130791]|nr:hypothetical protein AY600_07425 [Phormidium willei BDU 130791]
MGLLFGDRGILGDEGEKAKIGKRGQWGVGANGQKPGVLETLGFLLGVRVGANGQNRTLGFFLWAWG